MKYIILCSLFAYLFRQIKLSSSNNMCNCTTKRSPNLTIVTVFQMSLSEIRYLIIVSRGQEKDFQWYQRELHYAFCANRNSL